MTTYSDYGIQIPYGRAAGQVKTYCPQCRDSRHNKSDKSLSVDLDRGIWLCHHCGWKGTLNYKENWERMDYQQSDVRHRQRKTYKRPTPRQTPPLEARALSWFKNTRGISEQTLLGMKITESVAQMPIDGSWKPMNTVQFNYYKDGELVNTKYRDGLKHFRFEAGCEILPYNIDGIKGKKTCIITEGEMDALSFVEIGYSNCISVPAGGANTALEWLDDYMEGYFDDKETIFIASDTDTVGVHLRNELIRRFGPERCKVLDYGADCKDANEALVKHGRAFLESCLKNAQDVKVDGVFTVKDFEQDLDLLFEHGLQKGVTLGFPNFDQLCSFETKRLCIVTGVPSSGKSEWLDQMAERLNMRYGWRFAFFSPENAPLQYHAAKLIEKFTGKKFGADATPSLTPVEYREVKIHLQDDFSFIAPKDYRLDTILEKAQYLVRKRGIKCLVIDPYNRLEDEQGAKSETRYISTVLDKLQNFAQQNDVLVVLMAHPTKMPKDKDGKTMVPTLYDISGSANFFNKADFGIVVNRDRLKNQTEVQIQKVKFRHLGQNGSAFFKYNLNNGRYTPCLDGQDLLDAKAWDNTNHLTETRREREANSQLSIDFVEKEQTSLNMPFGRPLIDAEVPF